ncbi:MAG TPA: hypothetical protein VFS83_10555 [Ktedonobacterales bacterium]|nr:hypothetical protein [Ktedonobacterales bacterium]
MGQNDHGNDAPDSGDTNSPQIPSQQLVGDSQPNYPSELISSLKPMKAPPLQLQPPKNSWKSWLIGCSVAAGVVICLCTLMSFALFRAVYDPIVREQDAKASIQNFCQELGSQEYVLAYNHLSTAARGRIGTVDQFMTQVAILDQSEGSVTSCGIDLDTLRAAAAHSNGERMDVYVYVLRGNSTSNDPNQGGDSVRIMLVFENDSWKVDDTVPTGILF